MMNVAFIPVRGGSKSIPLKNIKSICGRPLVYWVVSAASRCGYIDRIYVATDDDRIKKTVESFDIDKVQVIGRSPETAVDTATTESAMMEFAQNHVFDNIVLIQATSPLLQAEDLNRGFEVYMREEVDSVLSVVPQKRFYWERVTGEGARSTNYDVYHRPRRQDFQENYVENGAFYICSREALLRTGNRLSGRIEMVEMCEDSFFEIDEPSDWVIIEALMKKNGRKAAGDLKRVKLLATDCDGVLTDGGMYYTEKGDEIKKFSTLDGMGFGLLRQRGIKTAIITGESNPLVARRGRKLQIDDVVLGQKDKLKAIRELCKKYDIGLENVVYIGDDIIDIEAIEMCGFGCAPANAVEEVREKADYVTKREGGNGCVREVIDKILRDSSL